LLADEDRTTPAASPTRRWTEGPLLAPQTGHSPEGGRARNSPARQWSSAAEGWKPRKLPRSTGTTASEFPSATIPGAGRFDDQVRAK